MSADLLGCEELDRELNRLLLDDYTPSPPTPPHDVNVQLAQLSERVLALESLIADALQTFQELAEARIERAAMDAATAVRAALDTVVTQDI